MKIPILIGTIATSLAFNLSVAGKPNVLFIAIDDLRPELGCYGSPQVKAPNLDKLASQGMVFSRAYCQIPVCGASRSSLMTGILPTPTRFIDASTKADKDAPGVTTLPQAFKDAGYTTISNGKIFHHQQDTQERSWSEPAWKPKSGHLESHDPETTRRLSEQRGRGRIYESPDVADDAYFDGQLALKTIDDLRRLKEEGKPFFLACGFNNPHLPFYAPKKYWDLYDHDKIEIANNRERPENAPSRLRGSGEFRTYHLADFDEKSEEFDRMMRHGYLACVSYVDKLVGDVLNELDRLELADNTIVVIWGDHGWHLGEHGFWGKHNTMHLSLQVPLIIRLPGGMNGGTADAIVEVVDVFPTLCNMAGVQVPETVQGRSFEGLFRNPEQVFRDCAYSRFKDADAVVTEHFVYTKYSNGETMLYDRKKDPEENVNVVNNPEYKKALGMMEALLEKRIAEAANAKL